MSSFKLARLSSLLAHSSMLMLLLVQIPVINATNDQETPLPAQQPAQQPARVATPQRPVTNAPETAVPSQQPRRAATPQLPVTNAPEAVVPAQQPPRDAVPQLAVSNAQEAEAPPQRPARAGTPQQPAPTAAPATAPPAKSPDYVEEKGFKAKVFEIKHRDPYQLQDAVRLLGSGFKGASVQANREMNTITIRDFPENIAAVEEAIKRLDVAEASTGAARPDLEIHVHILVASTAAASSDEFPAELVDVVKQLQGTLRYRSYSVMASAVHRASQGPQGIGSSGVAESKLFNIPTPGGNPIFYNYNMNPISLREGTGGRTIDIGMFKLSMRIPLNVGGQSQQIQYENVGFGSPVNVREGEKVVVGTTTISDKGIIIVLTAKALK